MYLKQGEVRRIGIEVVSQVNDSFAIDTADYSITDSAGRVIENGIPTIDGHKIETLFSANNIGRFFCEFTYRIGPEILKAKIYLEVK